jgi:hypothetical protein
MEAAANTVSVSCAAAICGYQQTENDQKASKHGGSPRARNSARM